MKTLKTKLRICINLNRIEGMKKKLFQKIVYGMDLLVIHFNLSQVQFILRDQLQNQIENST